ncbi:MAG TPA: hypothetical protein VGG49_13360 [Steroidobacteraceae bacterium]|jgi:hypothetical protein
MPTENQATLAFNRGVLSTLGLARTDITRYRMSAEVMTNWMARVLGSMMLRAGVGYGGGSLGNAFAKSIPFVFAARDTARLEMTPGAMRVWVNDALITRPVVSTAVTNGTFIGSTAGWTDNSQAGCTVTWNGNSNVSFVGTGPLGNNAILDQELTVNNDGSQTLRNALRIIVLRGPITLRLGTSEGDDSLINETILNQGTHSLAFTPGGATVWVRFQASGQQQSILGSCVIEGAGVMQLPAQWAAVDLPNLRWSQSADVIYIGCTSAAGGYEQQQVERRATDSWSMVSYFETATLGPFRAINITNVTLTPSGVTGDITLTASNPLFKPGHVGALFRLLSIGQVVTAALAAANVYTDPILVTGVGAQRALQLTATGTFSGELVLQYSVGAPGTWIDQAPPPLAFPLNYSYVDGLDNQTIYYRIGILPGDYTSGTANVSLAIPTGSITGIARVTGYQSSTVVNAAVLEALGSTAATANWYEGAWSAFRGFPATNQLWQGRLWWFGVSIFGSVSDDYNNFDDTVIGDSAPIVGQLDAGAVENVYWAVALQQLVIGTASAETSARSTYLGDPITPTNFNILTGSTQGSAFVNAVQVDLAGIFVQITGSRVFSLNLDIYTYSYKSQELTLMCPDFNAAGIVGIALQNKPDRRLHCWRTDGTVGVMVYDPTENVNCWLEVAIGGNGFVEDVCVLPGSGIPEDQVYYTVRRTINGQTVRYFEKWALEQDCTGLMVCKCMDSFVEYSGVGTTNLPQIAPHLPGQTVCVWGWNAVNPYTDGNGNQVGVDLGTYLVAADGSVTGLQLNNAPYFVTDAVVGLPYTAQWQSMKQAFAAAMGTPLNQPKRISRLGMVLQNTHSQGILMGPDFDHLDSIPQEDIPQILVQGTADTTTQTADSTGNIDTEFEMPDLNTVFTEYDTQMTAFNDIWSTDSRVCLQAASPRPCTVLAFTVGMTDNG